MCARVVTFAMDPASIDVSVDFIRKDSTNWTSRTGSTARS
jgi:hypothetical protein